MPGGYEIGCPLGEGMVELKRNIKILLDIKTKINYTHDMNKTRWIQTRERILQRLIMTSFFYASIVRGYPAG